MKVLTLAAAVLLLSFAQIAQADVIPYCATGTVADVLNTTCTIGNLQFTFEVFISNLIDFDIRTGQYTFYRGLDPASLMFDPAGNGFVLSSAPLSITGGEGYNRTTHFDLYYTVVGLNRHYITGQRTSGAVSVAGSAHRHLRSTWEARMQLAVASTIISGVVTFTTLTE